MGTSAGDHGAGRHADVLEVGRGAHYRAQPSIVERGQSPAPRGPRVGPFMPGRIVTIPGESVGPLRVAGRYAQSAHSAWFVSLCGVVAVPRRVARACAAAP